jgi:DNA polymerase-3 subunit gamma/tau
MLVRIMETLGQAVVDMRGTDAADPRLVLEIALVRLARREAGTPLQALAERIDRLERGVVPTASPAATASAVPSASAPVSSGRSGRSFAELRRDRTVAPGSNAPSEPAPDPLPQPAAPAASGDPAPAPAGEVDIDDVIVAWADILPELPPATRAAVREAQPIAVDAGVITFGVPRVHYDVAVPRFKKEADNIRSALSRRLGREMRFKPVPHDGFDAAPGTDRGVSTPPIDEEPPADDEIDLAELVDEGGEVPAVDSVTLITQSLGATVVEEVPRD